MANLLFLHAHPDDEAIFTGGTLRWLAREGHDITVVFCTNGSRGKGADERDLALERRRESEAAAEILGISHLKFLGYDDSGFQKSGFADGAFALADIDKAAQKLVDLIGKREIHAMFFDDENGTYGHPDHIQGHRVGLRAAQLLQVKEAAVFTFAPEQAHYHVVEDELEAQRTGVKVTKKHIVLDAYSSFGFSDEQLRAIELGRGREFEMLGQPSVAITHYVPVNGDDLLRKRQAMHAHKGQMPKEVTDLTDEEFGTIYGEEYYVRLPEFGDPENRSAEVLHHISR